MKKTFTTMAAAAAVWGLVTLPATAQSSGSSSSGNGSSQQSGSSSGSGATDQQGSSQGDQAGSGGTGQSGSGQTGTSGQSGTTGQSGTGQSGTHAGSGAAAGQTGTAPGSSTSAKTGSTSGASAKGSSQDRTFIMEAAAGGMAEVELGRLASQKASKSEVKEFGQMMVDDHTKANDQLMKIAQTKGLAAPHALKPQDKATQDRLSKLSGEAFDRAYMQLMVQDHKKDVSLFRKQSTSASDAEVKQFASSTLPTLEKHLSRAQEIEQTVGGGSGAKGTSGKSTTGASTGQSSGTSKSSTGSKTTPGAKGSTGGSGSHGSTGSGSGASGSGSSGSGATPPQR